MKFYNLEQGSAEWLAFRRTKVGASDAPIVLGISKFKTADVLLKEKLTGVEGNSNYSMKEGTRLEPIARQLLEQRLGVKLSAAVVTHDEHEWICASLDGLSDDHQILVEIKCGSRKLFEDAIQGVVPPMYEVQIQHQLLVTGLHCAIYCVYYEGEIALIDVVRWETTRLHDLLEKLSNFYLRMRESSNEPTAQILDSHTVVKDEEGEGLVIELVNICDQQKQLKEQIDRLEADKEALKRRITSLAPDQNFIIGNVKFSKSQRTSYDHDQMVLDGVDLKKYQKIGKSYWLVTRVR